MPMTPRADVPQLPSDSPTVPEGLKLVHTLRGHTASIGRIAWSSDGNLLATPSSDGTIRLWNPRTGEPKGVLGEHVGGAISVSFDPEGHLLASAGDTDERIKLWEVATGRMLRTFKGHEYGVNTVSFNAIDHTLASGGKDYAIKLWEASTGRLLKTLTGHDAMVMSVCFDPKGRVLASGSDDRSIRIWNPSTGELLRVLKGHQGFVNSVTFDPSGQMLASTSYDQTVKLWDVESGQLVRSLEGHTGSAKSASFSFDGRLLASKGGTSDDSIRLWRVDTGACIATVPEPASGFYPGLAFHPSLPTLAAAGSDNDRELDKLIRIWELNVANLLVQEAPTVTYTSAKIVLVGESSVGKSCLAMRIAEDRYPRDDEQGTTHGLKFWPMPPERLGPEAAAPEGQRRDVVLWDMGGQDEYRLVHQLFLHDTTLALVLLDPTRGRAAFDEVEGWNKRLEKQLHGRSAVKLLIGAKQDRLSDTVDRVALDRLQTECGFASYHETSALNGRGIAELRRRIAEAINWDQLAATSRPELFQRIRDEIATRRDNGEVVLRVADLHRTLGHEQPTRLDAKAIDAVTLQLATQGVIARSQVSTGEPVLVLQVQEIERYAGSLILAARNNPRGVPALELRAIADPDFAFPGIKPAERLRRGQEAPVLECTVQLLLEHGVCFQHEGLLIFPSLFAPGPALDAPLPHTVSLYYDFAGAIDNIYASLVAWLVLAENFGRVRLWADRAEFEVGDGGLCGLRRVARPGGFAHVDVYFGTSTPPPRQKLFISVVEEHLRRHGVEIRESVAVTCSCGQQFDEETLRKRIARGEKDVLCPVCETRHNFVEGAAEARQNNPKLTQWTWALKTQIEARRLKSTEQAVQVIEKTVQDSDAATPIRLLHLSDLHFTAKTPAQTRLQWLLDDLKQSSGLGIPRLDYLVISGDFTDRGSPEGFERAYEFVSSLTQEFGLSAQRCIFVPGNHDVKDVREAYEWREKADGLDAGEWVRQGEIILARNPSMYPSRFKAFSDLFYHKFLQVPYPVEYAAQGIAIPFWDTGLQFLTLNSCWSIDQFFRRRASLHPDAVAHVLRQAQTQESAARQSGLLAADAPLLRIGVWHHAVTGPDQMKDVEFLQHLQNNRVRIALHGDVHEMRRELVGSWHDRKLHILGSGSFGARAEDRPESMPRLYNLLEIRRDLRSAIVHTRCQPKPDGSWKGWNEWPRADGSDGGVAYYEIKW